MRSNSQKGFTFISQIKKEAYFRVPSKHLFSADLKPVVAFWIAHESAVCVCGPGRNMTIIKSLGAEETNKLQTTLKTHAGSNIRISTKMNTLNRFNENTSEQQFNSITRAITDNSSNPLFLMDVNGVCTFLNPTAEMIFGFTLAELQGKPLHDYIHHTHPDGSPFPLEKCPIGKSVFSLQNLKEYEDVFLDKDGKFIPIKCSAKPLSNSSGELTGILLEVRDIRSEKHAEKLLRRARSGTGRSRQS